MAKTTSNKKFTSEEIVALLRARFADKQQYVIMEQVANATGFTRDYSWIDVVIIGFWPSKGLTRAAFEIKVDRADFLREQRDPQKNNWARDCMHEFWYVAPSGVINHLDEVRTSCGWMEPQQGRLVVRKNAPRNESPSTDDLLIAALARAMQTEMMRQMNGMRDTIISSDKEILRAIRVLKFTTEWLRKKGFSLTNIDFNSDDCEQMLAQRFNDATMDKDIAKLQASALLALDEFRLRIISAWKSLTVVAQVGLLECDEAGETIHGHFGGEDAYGIAIARAKANDKGWGANEMKKYLEARDQISSFLRRAATES